MIISLKIQNLEFLVEKEKLCSLFKYKILHPAGTESSDKGWLGNSSANIKISLHSFEINEL